MYDVIIRTLFFDARILCTSDNLALTFRELCFICVLIFIEKIQFEKENLIVILILILLLDIKTILQDRSVFGKASTDQNVKVNSPFI